MALSDDQRAILELLLEQRQSYADISQALGVEEAEVRSRAGGAVASLGVELIAGDGGVVDLMLGQLDDVDARATRERIAADRELLVEARRLAALLRLALPAAEVPELPREPGSQRPRGPEAKPPHGKPPPGHATEPPRAHGGSEPQRGPSGEEEDDTAAVGSGAGRAVYPATGDRETGDPSMGSSKSDEQATEQELEALLASSGDDGEREESGRERADGEHREPVAGADAERDRPGEAPEQAGPSLERGQKRLLAVLLGGAFVVAAIVVGLSGSFGGDDAAETGEQEPPAAESAGAGEGTASGGEELIRADLTAQGGGEAEGAAIVGSVEDSPVLQVTARRLEPTGEGERYHLWLYSGEDFALRVAVLPVGRDGTLATQFELPVEVLQFVVDGRFQQVDISRAPERVVRREERRSLQERRAPRYVGESVLRGEITGPGIADPE